METLGLIVEPRIIKFENDDKPCEQKLIVINGGPNIREMYFDRGPMLKHFTFETNHTKPSKLAAGFEISAIIKYVCCTNETLVDNVVVHVDGKLYEVRLMVEPKKPKLVVKCDKIDFGRVVKNDIMCRECLIYNEGATKGSFTVSYPTSNMISKIDPMTGVIPEKSEMPIVVFLAPDMIGVFQIMMNITMNDMTVNIPITGTVMERLLELRDAQGIEVMTKVKFPPTFYGVDSIFDATLVNLTSDCLTFAMAFLPDENIDGNSGVCNCETNEDDDEDEEENIFFAGKNQGKNYNPKLSKKSVNRRMESTSDVALRLKERMDCCGCINPLPTLMTVSPSGGVLNPHQVLKIRFRFSPRWLTGNKGFKCFKMCPPPKEHIIDMTCLSSFLNTRAANFPNPRYVKGLPFSVEGISVPPEVATLPDDFLDLGFCMVGQHRQSSLLVYNRSPWLPCNFKIKPLAHFQFSVQEGQIEPNEELKIEITFKPKQSGNFKPYLNFEMYGDVCSEENIFTMIKKNFQTHKLKISGSSQYVVGGRMKQPIKNEGLSTKKAHEIGMNVEMRMNELTEQTKTSRLSINNFQTFKRNIVSNIDMKSNRSEADVVFYVKNPNLSNVRSNDDDDHADGGNHISYVPNVRKGFISNINNSTKLPSLNNQQTSKDVQPFNVELQPHFDSKYMFTNEEKEAVNQHKLHYNKYISAKRLKSTKRSIADKQFVLENNKAITSKKPNKNGNTFIENSHYNNNENNNNKVNNDNSNNNHDNNTKIINNRNKFVKSQISNIRKKTIGQLSDRASNIDISSLAKFSAFDIKSIGTIANKYSTFDYSSIARFSELDFRQTLQSMESMSLSDLSILLLNLPNAQEASRLITLSSSLNMDKATAIHYPQTSQERTECALRLSSSQLNFILIDPSVLDFESICLKHEAERTIHVTNNLDINVLIEFDISNRPELADSRDIRQVIPPKYPVEITIVLKALELGKYFQHLPYRVNGELIGHVILTAFVTIAYLELSTSFIELKQLYSLPSDEFVKGYVTITNPLNNDANFEWTYANLIKDVSEADPPVVVCPMKGTVASFGLLQCEICCDPVALKNPSFDLILIVKSGVPSTLHCYVELAAPKVYFLTPKILIKDATLKGQIILNALLKNDGIHTGYFKITDPTPVPELKIGPQVGKVPPGGLKMLSIYYHPKKLVWFDISVFVQLKQGKELELRIMSNVGMPGVAINVTEFKFGQVYCNTTSSIPFTLSNDGNSKTIVGFNLKGKDEFKIKSNDFVESKLASGKTPSTGFYLLKIGGKDKAHGMLEFSPTQITNSNFLMTLTLENLLTGKPVKGTSITRHSKRDMINFHISRMVNPSYSALRNPSTYTSKKSAVLNSFLFEPFKIPINAVVIKQPLLINRKEIHFNIHEHSLVNAQGKKTGMALLIVNNNDDGHLVFCLKCNHPEFQAGNFQVELIQDKQLSSTDDTLSPSIITAVDPLLSKAETEVLISDINVTITSSDEIISPRRKSLPSEIDKISLYKEDASANLVYENFMVSGKLMAGQFARIIIIFSPDCKSGRSNFKAEILLCHNSKPYLNIPVTGKVQVPYLSFSPPTLIFHPIPLHTKHSSQVLITLHNYRMNTMLYLDSFKVKNIKGKTLQPITLKFLHSPTTTEVHIMSKTSSIKTLVTLYCEEPISFSGQITFKDGFGNRFYMEVSGSCDNCLLSTYSFLLQNCLRYQIIMKKKLPAGSDKESLIDSLPDESTDFKRVPQFIVQSGGSSSKMSAFSKDKIDPDLSHVIDEAMIRKKFRTTFNLPRDKISTRLRKDFVKTFINSSPYSGGSNLNRNNNMNVDDGVGINLTKTNTNRDNILINSDDVINNNNTINDNNNEKKKSKTIIRNYKVIPEEEEDENVTDVHDMDINTDNNIKNNIDNNPNGNMSNIANINNNTTIENLNPKLFSHDHGPEKICIKSHRIDSLLDYSSHIQLRLMGNHFVPDIETAERMYFEHIIEALQKWITLHGWSNSLRAISIPIDFRKWNYNKEQKKISPEHSLVHLEKNLFKELFVHLYGRDSQVRFMNVLPTDDIEKTISLYKEYSNIIEFMRLDGACTSHIKPEFLLDLDEYHTWSEKIISHWTVDDLSEGGEGEDDSESLGKTHEMLLYEAMSLRSWMDMLFQLIKITVFKSITIKSYMEKPMPGDPFEILGKSNQDERNETPRKDWPKISTEAYSSNLYSVPERIVLSWMQHIYNEFSKSLFSHFVTIISPPVKVLSNFDKDLSDGLVLITVLYSHVPSLICNDFANIYLNARTFEERHHNAVCIVRAIRNISFDYGIEAKDITIPDPLSLLLFAAHLFLYLPSYIPKQKIQFLFQLHLPTFREIEISNPSSETLIYEAFIVGKDISNFGIESHPNIKLPQQTGEDAFSSIAQTSSTEIIAEMKLEDKVKRRMYRETSKYHEDLLSLRSGQTRVSLKDTAETRRAFFRGRRDKVLVNKVFHPDMSLRTPPNLNYNAQNNGNIINSCNNLNNKNIAIGQKNKNNNSLKTPSTATTQSRKRGGRSTVLKQFNKENGEIMKVFKIPPKSKTSFYISFHSKTIDSSFACLYIIAKKTSSTSTCVYNLGPSLVFNLEALLQALSLQQKELITVESELYQEKEIKIPVQNVIGKNVNFKIYLYGGSRYFGHHKKPFSFRNKRMSLGFFTSMKILSLKSGTQSELNLKFLPLAEKVYWCTILLRGECGDLCYLVCGVAKPPLIEQFESTREITGRIHMKISTKEAHWTCGVKKDIERIVYIPVVNNARDDAIQKVRSYLNSARQDYDYDYDYALTRHSLDRIINGSSEADPMDSFMDSIFKIKLTSPNFNAKDMIRIPNSKVTKERFLSCHRIVAMTVPLTIHFKSYLPGIYKTQVILTNLSNAYDNRIFEVYCTVLPMDEVPTIKMICAVGSCVLQNIPIINETMNNWSLVANIKSSISFTGVSNLEVPGRSTQDYQIKFSPFFEKTIEAELVVVDNTYDVRKTFKLVGQGTIGSASGTLQLDGIVGVSTKRKVKVFNPAFQRLEFFVQSNMDVFSGDNSFILMPKSTYVYEATITPQRRGRYSGVLTFLASDKKLRDPDSPVEGNDLEVSLRNFSAEDMELHGICRIWYEVELDVSPGSPLDTVEVTCFCLSTTEIEISVSNPLPQDLTFEITLSCPDLKGQLTFEVGGEQTNIYKVEYSSGFLCYCLEEYISFYHQKTGEFWYKLMITSTPIPSSKLPSISSEIGSHHVGQVVLRNPSVHSVKLMPFTSDLRCFSWNLDPLSFMELPSSSSLLVEFKFTPAHLHCHNSKMGFKSEQIGVWEFDVFGEGVVPATQQPIDIVCSPNNQAWHILPFINTTDFDIMINMKVTNEETEMNSPEETTVPVFSLLNKNKKKKLEIGERTEAVILFTPNSLRLYKGWNCIIEAIRMDGKSWDEDSKQTTCLTWVFPFVGRAQMICPEPKNFFRAGPNVDIVACFKTFVNEGINKDIEVTLECHPCNDERGNIDYHLESDDLSRDDLQRFVCIKMLEVCGGRNTTRIKFNVNFKSSKFMRHFGDLVLTNHRGGCWKYRLIFEAEENIPYREVHIWAEGLDRESRINFVLQHPEGISNKFSAKLSEDSACEFSFYPTEGCLTRHGVIFTVVFKPVIYGKIFKAKIIIETINYKWVYVVHGHSPPYDPPQNPPPPTHHLVPPVKKNPRINFVLENMKVKATVCSSPCKRN